MRQLLQRQLMITTRALGVMVVAAVAYFASSAAAGATDAVYWTAGSPPTALFARSLDGSGSPSLMSVGAYSRSGTAGAHTYTVTAASTDGLTGTASISYSVAAPPSVTITAPANHQTYTSDEEVSTTFSCTEGTGGPGLADCVDSNGDDPPEGFIDTSVIGDGTYTVTATSLDGQTASASISYTVIDETPRPRGAPVNTALPTISGKPTVGARLTASPGTWSGTQPIILHYLWQRCSASCVDIDGATASTYTVAAADVGAKIQVEVFAMNKTGRTSATSRAVGPVPRGGPSGPTAAQIRAALLRELAPYGRAAKLGTVVRTHGYAYDCTALIRGVMTISWYQVPKGAHLSKAPKPVLIATGRRTLHRRWSRSHDRQADEGRNPAAQAEPPGEAERQGDVCAGRNGTGEHDQGVHAQALTRIRSMGLYGRHSAHKAQRPTNRAADRRGRTRRSARRPGASRPRRPRRRLRTPAGLRLRPCRSRSSRGRSR